MKESYVGAAMVSQKLHYVELATFEKPPEQDNSNLNREGKERISLIVNCRCHHYLKTRTLLSVADQDPASIPSLSMQNA